MLAQESIHYLRYLGGLPYIDDLESGMRQAWLPEGNNFEVCQPLVDLCVLLSHYFQRHQTFIQLLDEIPTFAIRYLKAVLVCDENGQMDGAPKQESETHSRGNTPYYEKLGAECKWCHCVLAYSADIAGTEAAGGCILNTPGFLGLPIKKKSEAICWPCLADYGTCSSSSVCGHSSCRVCNKMGMNQNMKVCGDLVGTD